MGRKKALNPRAAFHHGDLAAAAEAAALALLEREGPAAVSMRGVAEACGVAHRSLYRHFDSREALLATLAAGGFDAVASALGRVDTRDDLVRVYGLFALKRPHLYAVMMTRPNASASACPALKTATDRLIAESLRILAPEVADPVAARRKVMRVWMALHGGVALHAAGVFRARNASAFVDEMTATLSEG